MAQFIIRNVMENENEATRIRLEFSDDLSLNWKVCAHEAANIWLKSLLLNLKSPRLIKNRFLGFSSSKRDEYFLSEKLNSCIEVINRESDYSIREHFKLNDSQEVLNKIHHHFSILIGVEGQGNLFWKNSSSQVKSAICGLNDYVHEIESWRNASLGGGAYCCIEFFEAAGMKIPSRWNELFSMGLSFGDMTLHYDQIGKSWIEVLIDEDDSIIEEAVRPLERVTGSFNINFFEVLEEQLRDKVKIRANSLGVDLDNPQLRLGQIKVASLDLEGCLLDSSELEMRIGNYQEIQKICITRGTKVLAERELSGNLECYFSKVTWE